MYLSQFNNPSKNNMKFVSKKLKNGATYSGKVRNKKFNGNGTYTFRNGNKYTGQFVNGNFHGWGIFNFFNGAIYKGYWKNNNFHGKGQIIYAPGVNETYDGDWKNGLEEGIGYHYNDNSKIGYLGNWVNGKRQGIGIYLYSNHCARVCMFKENKRTHTSKELKFIFKGNKISLQNKIKICPQNEIRSEWNNYQ
uniref:MORN repeat protein n=1 Tax=Mimivirus LCMiAC02 TaxID=2506609 RepID=A0A481Z0N2_9VIRU|nr:MAG: uncharacterized protein LCMiAC02_00720 [Mimivirus LCMiAC02]